jgi:hypothetical protein
VFHPDLLLKDLQDRQRRREAEAATDRLAKCNPHPIRELAVETGDALVQLGTRLRAWGEPPSAPAGAPDCSPEAA